MKVSTSPFQLSSLYYILSAQLKLRAAEDVLQQELDFLSFCLACRICEEITKPHKILVFGREKNTLQPNGDSLHL